MADVRLSNVRKSFGDVSILADIDLEVADGEFVVFVGPSGCGKSTLLRIVAGLEEASEGSVSIGGADVCGLPPARRGVAMVFQSYALYPHMTVYGNMAFGLKLAGVDKAGVDAAVRAAARKLRIEHLLDRKPKALSGGQRQRVAIGRAIVREPKVFLFDEPLSNLDASLRVAMRYEFAKLHEDLGTTMIYVTHDQVEAMTLADRIVVLSHGRIEQTGSPMELYQRPANLFVAGFIGSPKMNFLAGEIERVGPDRALVRLASGHGIEAALASNRAKAGDRVTLGVRPEHFDERAETNALDLKIRFVEPLGGMTLAYGTLGGPNGLDRRARSDVSAVQPGEDVWGGEDVELTVQLPGGRTPHAGEALRVGVDPASCHLFDGEGRAFERAA